MCALDPSRLIASAGDDATPATAVGERRPEFAEKIVEKYLSAQSNVFLVYGNTRDVYPVSPGQYVGLTEFFIESLIKPRRPGAPKIVLIYDPVQGIRFHNPLDRQSVAAILGEERLDRALKNSRTDVVIACSVLREITKLDCLVPDETDPTRKVRKDFAVIIRYVEAIAPAGSPETMLDGDRLKVITMENWFSDSRFIAAPDIVFMISETLSGMNLRITDLPYIAAIPVERPKAEERRTYIEHLIATEQTPAVDPERLAFSTAGLTLLSIRQIFRQAAYKGTQITQELVSAKTKEIIEKELEGHIEFPRLSYGFEKIIGASKLRKKLVELKTCIAAGDPELMPIGILVPGANGVGKTYIYKAFAKECGWVAVILKNIRGPYVGQTEKNWERIRSVLEAMGNVMVLYDEADTEIGGRGAQTHDVDKRLFGNILRMMSDPLNRGKIIWVIITARPDKLEPDIKRSGRAGEHLPVFDNEGEEKEAFIKDVLGRAGIDLQGFSQEEWSQFLDLTLNYYPADFDQLLTELKRRRLMDGKLTPAAVLEEIADFIPSDVARQREYQELLAVLECTSKELLPRRYLEIPREEIMARVGFIQDSMVGR